MKMVPSKMQGIAIALLSAFALIVSMASNADTKTAHQVAEEVKNELVTLVGNYEKISAQGEGKYYEAIVALFEPVVDFGFIGRGVMGEYADKASEEQQQRFAGVLKNSLMSTVATYTQGLAGTGDYKIEVVPPKGDVAGKKQVNVGLEVQTGESVNRLAFTMRLNQEEQWKIANMTLNGINLGVTFRAQFAQAVKKAEGDINAAIDSWQ